MCAGVVLHALRDFTDFNDDDDDDDKDREKRKERRVEAECWLMDTSFDDLEEHTVRVTFPQACALLDISPETIRSKVKGLDLGEKLRLGALLRRKKPPEEKSKEEEEYVDFFPE